MLTTEQLKAREGKIGGSDAAVTCGLSRWQTPRELYYIMRGEMPADPIDPINAFLGHQLEPMVVNWYVEQTGNKVRNTNRTYRNTLYPWAVAHPDRMLVPYGAQRRRRGLEIKTAATPEGWGLDGTDEIPDEALMQVIHYMEIVKAGAWDVAVFFLVSREFRRYTINRDPEVGLQLMSAERTFMEYVKAGTPPGWDFDHGTTLELMKRVYPGTDGTSVTLDKQVDHWWDVLEDARKRRAQYQAVVDGAKAHVLAEMGEHSLGYLPGGDTIAQKHTGNGAVLLKRRKFVNFQ